MASKTPFAKRLLLLVPLALYTALFAEVYLRVLLPQPMMPRYVTDGGDGIRGNLPNARYRHITPEVDVELRVNSQGLRADHELAIPKPEGLMRIALLGDSFFMGYEATLEESFAGQIESQLAAKGVRAEIVNLSVSGFGTAESLIALESRGLPFEPDLVVLEWHSTDSTDNLRSGLYHLDANGELVRGNPSYLPAIATRERLMRIPGYALLIQHSHLYAALRERAGRFVKNLMMSRMPWQRAPAPSTKASALADLPKEGRAIDAGALDRALVRRIQRVSKENGADFVLFDVPLTFSRTEFATSLQLLDAEFVARLPVLSPLARFQAEARPDQLLYLERGAGHWSARGNVIAAEHVVDYVLEGRLEPPPPESSGGAPTRAEAPTSTP